MAGKILALLLAVYVSTSTALPPCVCTRNYLPVCGSDGQTYANACLLNCQKTKTSDLTMVKEGQCETISQTPCICTYIYKPVCGTDGNTYGNSCALDCQKSKAPALQLRHVGVCEENKAESSNSVQVVEQPDAVKVVEQPNAVKVVEQPNTVKVVEQPNTVKVVEQPSEISHDCTCTRDLVPVCGSDGVTYQNLCILRCSGKVTVAHDGSCEQ